MTLLYGRAGRLTARNGGFRPGQARFSSYASSLAFANATYALEAELYPGVPLFVNFANFQGGPGRVCH